MPYYEVVYETGNHSVAFYDSDEEAKQALNAHQERAVSGQSGAPAGGDVSWPAERVSRVFVYDTHPVEYGAGQQVSADDLVAAINAMKDNDGLISAPEAAAVVRASSSPTVQPENPHDSEYIMPSTHELDLGTSSSSEGAE